MADFVVGDTPDAVPVDVDDLSWGNSDGLGVDLLCACSGLWLVIAYELQGDMNCGLQGADYDYVLGLVLMDIAFDCLKLGLAFLIPEISGWTVDDFVDDVVEMATVGVVFVPSTADLLAVVDCGFVLARCGCSVAFENADDVSVNTVVVAVAVDDDS